MYAVLQLTGAAEVAFRGRKVTNAEKVKHVESGVQLDDGVGCPRHGLAVIPQPLRHLNCTAHQWKQFFNQFLVHSFLSLRAS